jgi:hypothetical protein
MSKRIAIVGAGTAGLHLGLYLQQQGGQSTIFTDKKIEDYPNVRLLNTVAHHAVTVAREDDLGVNHWPDAGYFGHYYFIGGRTTRPPPMRASFGCPGWLAGRVCSKRPTPLWPFADRNARTQHRFRDDCGRVDSH